MGATVGEIAKRRPIHCDQLAARRGGRCSRWRYLRAECKSGTRQAEWALISAAHTPVKLASAA